MVLGIEKAYCLCLDKREEHWLDLEKQCESKGIEFSRFLVGEGKLFPKDEYDRIDGPPPKDLHMKWRYGGNITDSHEVAMIKKTHHYNAFLSHKDMARKALNDGHNTVLFLEDDAYFTDRFDDVASTISDHVATLDYDALYLGWWIGNEGDDFNEELERRWKEENTAGVGRTMRVGGLHGVVLQRRVLELVANELAPTDPIDSQLNQNFHGKIQSYCVAPKIIHDKGIFSHCEQSTTKRMKL